MLTIEDEKIYLTKGDDAAIEMTITDSMGQPYTMQEGDTLTLTVRGLPDDSSPVLLTATSVTSTIVIPSSDTSSLTVGEYSCDVQLKNAAGHRYTLYPTTLYSKVKNWKNFIIMPEVTYT